MSARKRGAAQKPRSASIAAPVVVVARPRLDGYKTQQRGLPGVMEIFHAHTIAPGAPESLSGIRPECLAALAGETRNLLGGAENGLRVVAALMSAHDPKVDRFDTSAVAWLLDHLAEEATQARELLEMAESRLLSLGYDFCGRPIDPAKWGAP